MATEEDRYEAVVQARYEGVDQFLADARKVTAGLKAVSEAAVARGQGAFTANPSRPALGGTVSGAISGFDPTTSGLTREQQAVLKAGIAESQAYVRTLQNRITEMKEAGEADSEQAKATKALISAINEEIRDAQALSRVASTTQGVITAEEKYTAALAKSTAAQAEHDRALAALDRSSQLHEVSAGSTSSDFAIRNAGVAQNRVDAATAKLADLRERAANGELLTEAAVQKANVELEAATTQNAHAQRSLHSAREKELAAAQRAASEQERLAAAQKYDNQSSLGKLQDNFSRGFRGRTSDASYAEQIGQAFKFSVFYGTAYKLLFALTQTFQAALQEGIQFEQGITDMQIATGRSRTSLEKLANQLAATAAGTGASPSAGLQVGAQAIGLYGATQASAAQQNRIALQSTRTISELAVTTKQDPMALQTTVAAVTRALGLGSSGQVRLADLDAYLTKRFGAAQGSTFQALESSATVGKQAGLSNEQLVAIASDLIGRTGQSGSAVGGYLAQIFTRGGEGSLTNVTSRYGIDQSLDLKDQLRALAKVYATADPNERNQIAAVGGRGKAQDAFVGLLQDFAPGGRIDSAVKAAQKGAGGELDREFQDRMHDVGGELQHLQGSLKELALELGESGILDGLGVLAKLVDELAQGTSNVLSVFNQLPRGVRDTLLALAAFSVALKAAGVEGGISGLVRSAPGALLTRGSTIRQLEQSGVFNDAGIAAAGIRPVSAAPKFSFGKYVPGELASSATSVGATALAAEGGVLATGARGVAALGASAISAIGPMGLAIGGLVAIGNLRSSADKVRQAQEQAAAQLQAGPGAGASADDLNTQATALRQNARDLDGATGKTAQILSFGHANDQAQAAAKNLRANADYYAAAAKAIKSPAQGGTGGLITTLDNDSITTVLQNIATGGGSAARQLTALEVAINGLDKQAQRTSTRIDTGTLGGALISGSLKGVKSTDNRVDLTDPFSTDSFTGGRLSNLFGLGPGTKSYTKTSIANALDPAIRNKLPDILKKLGLDSYEDLDKETATKVARSLVTDKVLKDAQVGGTHVSGDDLKELRSKLVDNLVKVMTTTAQNYTQAVAGVTNITGAQAVALAQNLVTQSQAVDQSLEGNNYSGKIANERQLLRNLVATRRAVAPGEDTTQLDTDIAAARKAIGQNAIDRLEALRKAAVAQATTQTQATAIGQSYVNREIRAAIRSGSTDQLVAVLETAGKGAVAVARKALQDALVLAREAQKQEAALAQFVAAVPGFAPAKDLVPGRNLDPKQIQAQLNSLSQVTSDTNPDQMTTPAGGTAAQIRAARAQALAQRQGGDVASARAAIVAARGDLEAAKKGTVDYYNALGSLYQAQTQLNEALAAASVNRKRLASDLTDPVKQAQLDLQAAKAKLAADQKSGAGSEVTTQDKIDIKNAQNSAEAEKFQQRLNDAQTADNLGKISHQAYLQYLQSEHDRLSAIKHKTRQQIDELNQIDGLIKDAKTELSGQFNIGNITLPTPYQIRRYAVETAQSLTAAAAQSSGGGGSVTHSSHDTVIYIDGADTGMVKKVIDDHVGKSTRVVTTAGRRNP